MIGVDSSRRFVVAKAIALGAAAGLLESRLTLMSGIMPPLEVLANLLVLVCVFAFAGWVTRASSGFRSLGHFVLALLAVLPFAARGCLADCTTESLAARVLTAAATLATTAALLFATRRRLAPIAADRAEFAVLIAAMTFSALDFAKRDGARFSAADTFGVLALMSVVALSSVVWAGESRRIFTASIAIGVISLAYATMEARPLVVRAGTDGRLSSADAPNVILVVMDTVRADHTTLYGYSRDTTPNLNALAKESLIFERGVASGNYSLTSHASLFTGVLPSTHGAHQKPGSATPDEEDGIAADLPTLADKLAKLGLATAGVSANHGYLAPWTGLQRGFQSFDDHPYRRLGYHPFVFPLLRRLEAALRGAILQETLEWDASSVSNAALAFARMPRPFFLFLNYFDAHRPYDLRGGFAFKADNDKSSATLAYDSEIAYIDRAIGALIDGLRTQGRWDRTILIVVADHGESLGQRGWAFHKNGAYEPVLHIPMLVHYPKEVRPGRVARPTGLHEIHQLILDLVERRSIEWAYEPLREPAVLSQVWSRVSKNEQLGPAALRPFANVVYFGPHKLIARASGTDELYDLETDPGETRNLLDGADAVTTALKNRMREALSTLPPPKRGVDRNPTEADLAALRALGYIR